MESLKIHLRRAFNVTCLVFAQNENHSLPSCVSVPDGFRVLDVPYSNVQNVLLRTQQFYCCNTKPVLLFLHEDTLVRKLWSFNSLIVWWLTSVDHGIFCGVAKLTFAVMKKLTPTTADNERWRTFRLGRILSSRKSDIMAWFLRSSFFIGSYISQKTANGIKLGSS